MGVGEVGGDRHGLPAKKNKQPEHEVKKEGGKDEGTDIDTRFSSPDGQCRAYVTCKHGDPRGEKSLPFDLGVGADCADELHLVQCVSSTTFMRTMRTNIVIDDKLMADTLRATGLRTKREVVELGLKTLLQLRGQAEIRKLRGKITWEGDLDAMRRDK